MSATSQIVFERAVKHHLPTVFITELERVDEFNLDQVLLYHHKHHWYTINSRREVDYTGMPLENILAEGELKTQYKVETEKTVLFSATSDQSNRTVDVDLDLDAEVSSVILPMLSVYLVIKLHTVNHTVVSKEVIC